MCPLATEEGDILTLFRRATVPYLLQPVRNTDSTEEAPASGEGRDEYKLVGECFVEGIMDRELMDEKSKSGEPAQVFALV